MADNDYPIINTRVPSWANFRLSFAPIGGPLLRTMDFTAFSFKEKLEPGQVRGAGTFLRGSTTGIYTSELSVKLLLRAHLLLVEELKKIAKREQILLGEVPFSIAGKFRMGRGQPRITVSCVGCRITERGIDMTPDTNATEVETPLFCPLGRIDGVSLGEIPK